MASEQVVGQQHVDHRADAPDEITEHRPSIPPALAAVVMRCLRNDPGDRWRSSEELLGQLVAMETLGLRREFSR